MQFPSIWAQNADEYIHKGLQLNDDLHNNDLIHSAFGPHAPYTVQDETLSKIQTYADELDSAIHIHLHETEQEVLDAIEQNGERPIARLNKLGLLSPKLQAVHMTELNAEEIELIANTGTQVVHCPQSNLKLASGFCPVKALMDAGVNVALGTDGAASNNDLDMLGEMQSAALIAKAYSKDASALNAAQALSMATINGAKLLGIDDRVGSLETNKDADLIAIDLNDLSNLPVFNPISQIVYSASRQQVTYSWVKGKMLLNNRQLTTLDSEAIKTKAKSWADKISAQS